MVAPHAGAWIEILNQRRRASARKEVAPHAGAWIEIFMEKVTCQSVSVAPHAGAWIEIEMPSAS